jgi:predicted RNase H-like HicB family nuclease
MSTAEDRAFTVSEFDEKSWDRPARRFECKVLLCTEEEGGYSAHALNIAGVVSEGDTIDEALVNIADAFKATIEYCLDSETAIPWREDNRGDFAGVPNTIERWIAVDV